MAIITFKNGNFSIDKPLYQWDKNITLKIKGLTLPSTPEIHFSNSSMRGAIVKTATVEDDVVVVTVPNGLLEVINNLKVYVCFYQGEEFTTDYRFILEITPREKPNYYSIQDDEDVYSFNELRTLVENYNTQVDDKIQEAKDQIVGDFTVKLNTQRSEIVGEIHNVEAQANANYETVNERVNNLVATDPGSTGDNAELLDIRVGSDGKVYSTAGEAVRKQIKSIIDNEVVDEFTTNYRDMTVIRDHYLKNGVEKEMSGYAISDYIPVDYSDSVFFHYIRYNEKNSGVALYDKDKNYLGDSDSVELGIMYITNANYDARVKINTENAKYVRYTFSTSIEGNIQRDSSVYHISDAYVRVTHTRSLYVIPEKIEGMIKEKTIAPFIFNECNTAPKKILTWIDDDTNSDTYVNSVKTICDNLGIKCTFATITDRWGTSNSASLDTLHQLQKEGYHITSHTGNHKRWYTSDSDGSPKFTAQELETDLIESLQALNSEGFIDSDMLVYPGSSATRTDIDVISIVKKWCSCGVLAGGNNWSKYGNGKYKINRTFFDKSTHDASYYKSLLDNVGEESWVLFGSHSATASQFDADMITDVLQYALNNGWVVMTLNEAIKYRQKYYNIQEIFGFS